MAKRIFRIEFGSMGGELVIGKVDEQFVENSLRIINNQSLLDELAKKSYDKVFQYRTENIVQMYLDCLVRFEKV